MEDESHVRFNPAEVGAAIRAAIVHSWPTFKRNVIDETTLTYDVDTQAYPIPATIEFVRKLFVDTGITGRPWKPVLEWRQVDATLYIERRYPAYDGERLRMIGAAKEPPFISEHVLSATYTHATKKVVASAATFLSWGVEAGDYLDVYAPPADVGVYKIRTVDNETQVEVEAAFASGADATGVKFGVQSLDDATQLSQEYIVAHARYWLYEREASKGAGKDVTDLLTKARHHFEMGELLLTRLQKDAAPKGQV